MKYSQYYLSIRFDHISFVCVASTGGRRLGEWDLFRGLQKLQIPCWLCAGAHWRRASCRWLLPHSG